MATKLDNDLAKHISNFGYNAVDTLFINSNGFTASIDGTLTANRTLTIPDNSGTIALLSDIAGGGFLPLTGGTLSGPLTFSDAGNVNNPAIQFVDAKLGIYRHGSNHLRIGVNGTAVQGWQQSYIENLQRVRNVDGAEATPAITFANNQDMGLWRVSGSELGISTGGVKRLSVTDTEVSVNLLPFYVENYKSNNIGAAGNTVYGSLTNDLGMYFDFNRINFSTNAVERLNIQNTAITSSVKMLLPDSGVGFSSSPTTMIQYTGSNRIGMYSNNSLVLQLTATAVDCRQPISMFNLGSAAAPQIINSTHSTTGLYWQAGPILNIAVSGTQRVSFASDGVRLYGSTAGNNALYVPSPLQYYEEATVAATFTFDTRTASANIYLTRTGRVVVATITSMTFTAPITGRNFLDCVGIVPLRFRPITNNAETVGVSWVNEGSGTSYTFWNVIVNFLGTITYQRGNGIATNLGLVVNNATFTWTLY